MKPVVKLMRKNYENRELYVPLNKLALEVLTKLGDSRQKHLSGAKVRLLILLGANVEISEEPGVRS